MKTLTGLHSILFSPARRYYLPNLHEGGLPWEIYNASTNEPFRKFNVDQGKMPSVYYDYREYIGSGTLSTTICYWSSQMAKKNLNLLTASHRGDLRPNSHPQNPVRGRLTANPLFAIAKVDFLFWSVP
jgi:hypothetical protein